MSKYKYWQPYMGGHKKYLIHNDWKEIKTQWHQIRLFSLFNFNFKPKSYICPIKMRFKCAHMACPF